MKQGLVSIIIPARNEKYLPPTIDTILERAGGDIEIIPILDGYIPDEPINKNNDSRVKPVFLEKSIGQRAGYNLGVQKSSGEYIMKLDGHAIVSPNFDIVLKEAMRQCGNMTVIIPEMRRLDAKNWEPKRKGRTRFMYFGTDLMCGYWNSYKRRPEAKEKYPEVMTGQGSCWFVHREWNDYIGMLDEKATSWGKVGLEVSIKTWCHGGSQRLCKEAWQAHHFRVGEGGFPYPRDGRTVSKAHDYALKNWYFNINFFGDKQVRSFRWIIEKFAPVPGWEIYMKETKLKRGIIYYTDHSVEESLAISMRNNILLQVGDLIPVISVSQVPINFGDNICVGEKPRNYISLYEQILTGLENIDADVIYLCEHDVVYHSSHFSYLPEDKSKLFYNEHCYYWKMGRTDYIPCPERQALSQLVAYKKVLMQHVKQRLKDLKKNPDAKVKHPYEYFRSEKPNVDIRHGNNFSGDGKHKQKYYSGNHPDAIKNIGFWGSPRHMMKKAKYKGTLRTDIINYLIEQNNYESYLEIGYKKGDNFKHIKCDYKDSVDPNGRAKYNVTSDDFFKYHVNGNRYDIVFIDGLHEANQVLRDIDNSLQVLNDGGVIVMHDCLPEKEEHQIYPAPETNIRIWNGNVWKAFVIFNKDIPDGLEMYTVDTNNGIGIIKPSDRVAWLGLNDYDWSDDIETLTWNYFKQNRNELMNVVSVEEFKEKEKKHA